MNQRTDLAEPFARLRAHLHSVAYRILGSVSDADDAVQEAWMRLDRGDTDDIENLGGWLTTVVARICLDMLRSRRSRPEEPLDEWLEESALGAAAPDADKEIVLAESVGSALMFVLETLSPPERVAFVLHDLFAIPFDEIASVLDRSPVAVRQLASRARRRMQGQIATSRSREDRASKREIVEAFLAASRTGDFVALLSLLAPDVVLTADTYAARLGAAADVRGADAVAKTFAGRARDAQPALVEGEVGLVWAPGGTPRVAFRMTIRERKIVAIGLIADPAFVGRIRLTGEDDE